MEQATFGAGCFWGVEEAFRRVDGVTATAVGYAGGTFEDPTYEDVCSGKTGPAEVVRLQYDPARVMYEDLLQVFWDIHDPTTLNMQGANVGTQYRSVVFCHDDNQAAAARASKEALQASGRYPRDIVTEITPASTFYMAGYCLSLKPVRAERRKASFGPAKMATIPPREAVQAFPSVQAARRRLFPQLPVRPALRHRGAESYPRLRPPRISP